MAWAQVIPNYTIQITVQPRRTSPISGEVQLHWIPDSIGGLKPTYSVFRRTSTSPRILSTKPWTRLGAGGTNGNTDLGVPVGKWLEYRVEKSFAGFRLRGFDEDFWASGFVITGIDPPEETARGRVLVLVDTESAQALRRWDTGSNRLDLIQRYLEDLAGDGWEPQLDAQVPPEKAGGFIERLEQVRDVKRRIRRFYQHNPATSDSVVLMGSIPIPYSGYSWFPEQAEMPEKFPDYELNGPDRHYNVLGDANGVVTREDGSPVISRHWPADAFYGDVTDASDSRWLDESIRWKQKDWPLVDGVFDPAYLPEGNRVHLSVGRIDFRSLPSFVKSGEMGTTAALRLLANYLEKNHARRHGLEHPMGRLALNRTARRGVVVNNFSDLGGEAPAALPLGGFAPVFGSDRLEMIFNLDPSLNDGRPVEQQSPWYVKYGPKWFQWLRENPVLCADGCGPGSPNRCAGVAETSDYAADVPPVAFQFLFGSYFSEWSSPDNLLRASIAAPESGLAAMHGCRPKLVMHPLAVGKTIGDVFRTSINNGEEFPYKIWLNAVTRGTHLALMGDPTLRLHVVPPVEEVRGRVVNGVRDLSWTDCSRMGGFAGYEVWNGPTSTGPFSRVSTPWWNEYRLHRGPAYPWYLIKVRRRESTPSGTYINTSQGRRLQLPFSPGGREGR